MVLTKPVVLHTSYGDSLNQVVKYILLACGLAVFPSLLLCTGSAPAMSLDWQKLPPPFCATHGKPCVSCGRSKTQSSRIQQPGLIRHLKLPCGLQHIFPRALYHWNQPPLTSVGIYKSDYKKAFNGLLRSVITKLLRTDSFCKLKISQYFEIPMLSYTSKFPKTLRNKLRSCLKFEVNSTRDFNQLVT